MAVCPRKVVALLLIVWNTQNISPLDRFKSLSENEQQIVQAIKGVEVQYQTAQYEFQLELFELKKKVRLGFPQKGLISLSSIQLSSTVSMIVAKHF